MAVAKFPTDLKAIRYKPQTVFATDVAPSNGDDDLRASDIKFAPTLSLHRAGYQKAESGRGFDAAIPGALGGTLTFKIPLRSSAGVSVAPFMLLAQYIGTFDNFTASPITVATAASGSSFTVGASSSDLDVGQAVMIQLNDLGTPEIRFITALVDATDTVTVDPPFSSTPTVGDTLQPVATLYSTDIAGPLAATEYQTFVVYSGDGATNSHAWTIGGCAGSWKLAPTDADSIPYIEFTYLCDRWVDNGPIEFTPQPVDAFNAPTPLLGAPLSIDGTAVPVQGFEFDPGIKLVADVSSAGVNGRAGFICTGDDPKPKFKPYWENNTFITKYAAGTEFALHIEDVKDLDEGWAMYFPKCQIMSMAEGDIEGIAAHDMEIELNDPGISAGTPNVLIPRWAIALASV